MMEAFHPNTCSSQANSSVVEETSANVTISNQENLPTCSEPSLLNHSSCLGTTPGDMKKKSRHIPFAVKRKFLFISFRFKKKKENKLSPMRTSSDSHQSRSTSGETSWREPEGCASSKKPCKLLPRIFSMISKTLHNSVKPKST
ncbi:hypothetical protein AOLI_G00239650 [Acnodon oligacanthus]